MNQLKFTRGNEVSIIGSRAVMVVESVDDGGMVSVLWWKNQEIQRDKLHQDLLEPAKDEFTL